MAFSGFTLWLFLVSVVLFNPAVASAQTMEPFRIDVAQLGPQVGEIVPDFSLRDQNGELWTRDAIMGPNGAMLVFFRSAGW